MGCVWVSEMVGVGTGLPAWMYYLAGGERGLLVVPRELAGLGGDALVEVVDEGVEDGDAPLGDARVGVDL